MRRGRYPEEAYGRDVTVLAPLRDKLRDLEQELARRAGEPELMKTEAAERMRQKLEKRLLPKLKVRLRKTFFLRALLCSALVRCSSGLLTDRFRRVCCAGVLPAVGGAASVHAHGSAQVEGSGAVPGTRRPGGVSAHTPKPVQEEHDAELSGFVQ